MTISRIQLLYIFPILVSQIEGFTVKKNNLLSTLDHWGPSFNVSFELKADNESFIGNGLKSVLQFTSTGKGCCNPGDRILAVYLKKSKIQIVLEIHFLNSNGIEQWYTDHTYEIYSREIKPKQWYTIVLTQTFDEESITEYLFEAKLDNEKFASIEHNARSVDDVKVYAGLDNENPEIKTAIKVQIQNLSYFNLATAEDYHAFLNEYDIDPPSSEGELQEQQKVFFENFNQIQKQNNLYEQGMSSWKLKVNEYTDLTIEQFENVRGIRMPEISQFKNLKTSSKNRTRATPRTDVPDEWNWVTEGAVSPVQNQGGCGSCAAFAAVAAIESCFWQKTGKMSDLSEQHLMDCAKGQCYADFSTNWCAYGCGGAWPQPYFDWTVNQNGGRFEQESCTPYHAYEKECQPKEDCIYQEAKLDGFHVDYESNEEDLKYLVYEGPVLVALYASYFGGYSEGVYDDERCCKAAENEDCRWDVNHAVLVVGYGTEDGKDYWLIKNSWSTGWGDDGYIKIRRGVGLCGVGMNVNLLPICSATEINTTPGLSSTKQETTTTEKSTTTASTSSECLNGWIQNVYSPIIKNNLITTLTKWGPTWKVSFELTVHSFLRNTWMGIFHFTTGDNCCAVGDRVPALQLYNDYLYFLNAVNNDGNFYVNWKIEAGMALFIEIKQTLNNDGKIHYEITVDGQLIHSSINEGNLLEFENVYVYGSDPFDDYIAAADASYSKLCIQQLNADLEWCPKKRIPIRQRNKLGVIPKWGPAWKISFGLKILSFNNGDGYFGNIFRFTSTKNDCCNIGDRIPALFTTNDNRLHYVTNIDGNGNEHIFSPNIETGKRYSFEIKQHFTDGQWRNEITMKDDMDQEIWKFEYLNITSPDAFTSVSVFAGDKFFNPSDAIIRYFHFSSGSYSC